MPRYACVVYLVAFLGLVSQHALAQDLRLVPVENPGVDTELIDQVMSSGTPRVLVLGDSFSMTLWSRVPPLYTALWDYGPVVAFTGTGSPGNRMADFGVIATPFRQIEGGADGYLVYPGSAASGFFGLPIRGMSEFHFNDSLSTFLDRLGRLRIRNDLTADATGAPLIPAGSSFAVRLLYHAPSDLAVLHGPIELVDEDGNVTPLDLRNGARGKQMLGQPTGVATSPTPGQINSAATEPVYALPAGSTVSQPTTFVNLPSGSAPTGGFVSVAGAVYRRVDAAGENIAGVYYSVLADNSWSYVGLGSDRAASGPTDKAYSVEQLAHWLDATTINPNQPIVAIYYLAAEQQTRIRAEERIEAMIDQTNAAAATVGLSAPVHMLVLPHYHQIGQRTDADVRERFEWQRDAMFAIAERRPDTAAASIYDATGGVLFDGSPEAVSWLAANGYSSFPLGDATYDLVGGPDAGVLLDGTSLHPRDIAGAAVFADVLNNIVSARRAVVPVVEIPWHTIDAGGGRSTASIFELTGTIGQPDASRVLSGGRYSISGGFWPGRANAGCNPADIEQPFGVLDIDDVLLFLDAFATNNPIADLSLPSGVLDIDDVLVFLDRFAAGCE